MIEEEHEKHLIGDKERRGMIRRGEEVKGKEGNEKKEDKNIKERIMDCREEKERESEEKMEDGREKNGEN